MIIQDWRKLLGLFYFKNVLPVDLHMTCTPEVGGGGGLRYI